MQTMRKRPPTIIEDKQNCRDAPHYTFNVITMKQIETCVLAVPTWQLDASEFEKASYSFKIFILLFLRARTCIF